MSKSNCLILHVSDSLFKYFSVVMKEGMEKETISRVGREGTLKFMFWRRYEGSILSLMRLWRKDKSWASRLSVKGSIFKPRGRNRVEDTRYLTWTQRSKETYAGLVVFADSTPLSERVPDNRPVINDRSYLCTE